MSRQRNPLPIPQMQCPLGDEHCDLLDMALSSCNDTACYLDKLEALGLDVSGWRSQVEHHDALAKGLKQIHFPHRP